MRPQLLLRFLLVLLTWLSVRVAAQEVDPFSEQPSPITVVYVEGRVDTVRASRLEPTVAPDLLEDDDRLVTGDGRAELAFADGTLVHLDRRTDVRLDLGGQLRLVRGRVVVHTPRDAGPLAVSTPAGVVRMQPNGEYDLAATDLDGDTIVTAILGRAVLEDADHEVPIASDDQARLDPRDRRPRWARAAPPDEFRRWAADRVDATTRLARTYDLPDPLAPYASQFARHGEWTDLPEYGRVWMPSAAAGWRPYTNGAWRFTRYGWTWIDAEPWAWPVHHFGRWGRHEQRGWFWMPQRTWGPAWVGWAVAADHLAWSPLGRDARPVVDFFAGTSGGPVNAWANSWSVLPRRFFGGRGPVLPNLQDPRGLPGPVLGGFVSQLVGPRGPAGANDRFRVPRGRGGWTGSVPGGAGNERRWRSGPSDERPESFGSAAPARPVGGPPPWPVERAVPPRQLERAAPRGAPAPRGSAGGERRRPGDARTTDERPAPAAQPQPQTQPGQLPDGRMRQPNAIRPRYDPPVTAAPTETPAPPAVAPQPLGTGNPAGVRQGGEPRERPRPPAGRAGGAAGAEERGEGRPAPPAAPAPPRGQRIDGHGEANRRRPR